MLRQEPIESHTVHSSRLMRQALEELAGGDRVQASEKAWGAVVHALKVIAGERGAPYETHRDAFRLVHDISTESPDWRALEGKYAIANGLHRNYYEDSRSVDELARSLEQVSELLDLLTNLQASWKERQPG